MNDWQLLQRELERSRAESAALREQPRRFPPQDSEWLGVLYAEGVRQHASDFATAVEPDRVDDLCRRLIEPHF
jgi:hypothetical protein